MILGLRAYSINLDKASNVCRLKQTANNFLLTNLLKLINKNYLKLNNKTRKWL